jgi:hypothetical protein
MNCTQTASGSAAIRGDEALCSAGSVSGTAAPSGSPDALNRLTQICVTLVVVPGRRVRSNQVPNTSPVAGLTASIGAERTVRSVAVNWIGAPMGPLGPMR